jgi:hypothetical protein
MALGASLVLGATPALAAAPSNDSIEGATPITNLPSVATQDTTEATTDSVDVEANEWCGAPVTLASVWFDYTADTSGMMLVDVSASDYSAGVIVVQGNPGSLNLLNCAWGSVAFDAYAGSTYHIMAFSDTPGVNGGTLQIKVDVAPPPPTLAVKVESGKVNPKTGIVTLSGTVDCTSSSPEYGVEVDLSVKQPVGRVLTVTGEAYTYVECGSSVPFSAVIVPSSGLFKPGTVTVSMWAYTCDNFGCADVNDVFSLKIKK